MPVEARKPHMSAASDDRPVNAHASGRVARRKGQQVSLSDLSSILWREREMLELLLFKLEEEQLILASGRSRWLTLALSDDRPRAADRSCSGRWR